MLDLFCIRPLLVILLGSILLIIFLDFSAKDLQSSEELQYQTRARINETLFEMKAFISKSVKYRPNLGYATDLPVSEAFKHLVEEYLAPWRGLSSKNVSNVPVTQRGLATLEYAAKGGSFRVRIVNGTVYFRKLIHYTQHYRTECMLWYLQFLDEILRTDRLLSESTLKKGVDFVIYVGDAAKITADTFTTDSGFPLFSLRTTLLHIDIPIPDSVAYGSHGEYVWSEAGKRIPWEQKKAAVIFRGKASCLKMQADNWHICNRVRLPQLSKQYPESIDAGIIQWNQLYNVSKMVSTPATIEEVERTTGLTTVQPLDFEAQSRYKYIIDTDGGAGSSRKASIIGSGSVLFATDSPYYMYYEPLLQPYKHYIPVDRWFRNLPEQVEWAREHDDIAKSIMQNSLEFEAKYLTLYAAKLYMATLLNAYVDLLDEPVPGDQPVPVDYCVTMGNTEVRDGPMGCSQNWIRYEKGNIPASILSDRKIQQK